MNKNMKLIKITLPYFVKYRKILILDLIAASLTTVAGFILPIVLSELTNLGMAGTLTVRVVATLSITYGILKIIETIARYYMTNIGHRMGAMIETDMRSDFYDHLMGLPTSYYNDTKVGQIMTRVTSDLADITEFAHHAPEELFIVSIQMVVSLLVLGNINGWLTLFIFLLLPLMFIFSRKNRVSMKDEQMNQRRQIGNLNAGIEDSLSGIRVVKSFANEPIEINKFEGGNQNFLNIKTDFYIAMASFTSTTSLFEGDATSVKEVELVGNDAPNTLEAALGTERTGDSSASGAGGGSGGESALHGHTETSKEKDIDRENYFRIVDKYINEHYTSERDLPLILYALPENQAVFRKLSKNNHLIEDGIEESGANVNFKVVQEKALAKNVEIVIKQKEKLFNRFRETSLKFRVDNQLNDLAMSATEGRIEELLVNKDYHQRGIITPEGEFEDVDHDFVKRLITRVISTKGKVFVVNSDDMPVGINLSARLRY